MTLLVTGCPRNGTRYFHNVLNRVGYEVGHECIRGNGVVSGFYVGDFDDYPVNHPTPPSKMHFKPIIHLVRDPRKAIPSIAALLRNVQVATRWYEKQGLYDQDYEKFAMKVWLWSHKNTRNNLNVNLTVNLEKMPDSWPALQKMLAITKEYPYHVRIDNSYPFLTALDWEDFYDKDEHVAVETERFWRYLKAKAEEDANVKK